MLPGSDSVFGAAIKPGTNPWVIGGIVAAVGLAGPAFLGFAGRITYELIISSERIG